MKTKMILLFIGVIFGLSGRIAAQNIVTVAGNVGIDSVPINGALALSCNLINPTAVTTDDSGNIYFSDFFDGVYKISPDGVLHYFAGSNGPGFGGDGGQATNANISYPIYLAVDTSHNVYISDRFNNRIRKVSANGIISTIAGTDSSGYDGIGGPATAAELNNAWGVAVDKMGNVYISEQGLICKIDSSGILTSFAGNGTEGFSGDGGPATDAQIYGGGGITVDDTGNVYFADGATIRKIDITGIITTIAGNGTSGFSGDGGPATSAEIGALDVAIDRNGNLFFLDGTQRIREVNTSGIINTIAGNGFTHILHGMLYGGYNGDSIPATSAELNLPWGLSIDKNGTIYIADWGNYLIRKVCNCAVNTIPATTHNSTMSIYPNPNNGEFTISLPPANFSTTIIITDLLGKVVQIQNFPAQNGINVTIHLENMPPGPYLVKTDVGGEVFRDKVVRW